MKINNFVVIDVESTGLKPEENEIIEIGMIKIECGKITQEYQSYIKPTRPISSIITRITGISGNHVKDAPSFKDIAADIVRFIGNAIIVGHNVNFDYMMLNKSLEREGLPQVDLPTVDSIDLFAVIHPEYHSYKLSDIVKNFLGKTDNFHRALTDAKLTAEIFLESITQLALLDVNLLFHINSLLKNSTWPLANIINYSFSQKEMQQKGLTFSLLSLINEAATAADTNEPLDKKFVNSHIINKEITEKISKQPKKEKLVISSFDNIKSLFFDIVLPNTDLNTKKTQLIITSQHESETSRLKNIFDMCLDEYKKKTAISCLNHGDIYICLFKLETMIQKAFEKSNGVIDFLPVLTWLSHTQTGNTRELHSKIYDKLKNQDYFKTDFCFKNKCPYFKKCFIHKFKKQLSHSTIILTHHEYFFDTFPKAYVSGLNYKKVIILEPNMLEKSITNSNKIIINQKLFRSITDIVTEAEIFIRKLASMDEKIIQSWSQVYIRTKNFRDITNLIFKFMKMLTTNEPLYFNKKFSTSSDYKQFFHLFNLLKENIDEIKNYSDKLSSEAADLDCVDAMELSLRLRQLTHNIDKLTIMIDSVITSPTDYKTCLRLATRADFKVPVIYSELSEATPVLKKYLWTCDRIILADTSIKNKIEYKHVIAKIL